MKSLSSKTYQCGVTIEGLTTLAGITYLTGITNTTSWDHVIVGTTAQGQIYTRTYAQFMTDVATGIGLSGYVPTSRTLTINGTSYDLSADRTWTINTVAYTSRLQHQVKAGVAINKGQAVYVTSADGTNMIVGLASNASEATSSKTMGLLDATVTTNGFANVVTEGLLAGLDTSTAGSEGDPVWLGTGGNLIYGLANKPSAPAHLVFIGIVTRKNISNGEIFVKVQNGFELDELHNVDLKTTVPVNGHILGFDGTLWVNKTIAGWLGYTPANASGTTNYLSKFTGSTTLGNSLVYDNGTNVGIGTTSPSQKLDVSSNGGRLRISQNINASTFNGLEFADYTGVVDGGLIWNQNTGEIRLNAASSYFPTFYSSGVEAMRIATGGQVIVGGTTVGYAGTKLQVGNISDSQNGLNILTSTTGYGYILFGDGAGADTYVGQIWYYHGDNYMGFQTNGSEKMRITAAGNVLVGTATDGGYRLDVNGTSRYKGIARFENSSSNWILIDGSESGSNHGVISSRFNQLQLKTNTGAGTPHIALLPATGGNVGIGTTNPLFTLDVNGITKLRTATYFGQISQPSAPTLGTNSPTGGTLPADTYTYRISALDFWNAETTPSNSLVVTTTGSTSSVSMSWPLVQGAYNYRIYRTNSGGTTVYYTVSGTNSTSFTDTGAAGTVGVTASVNSTAYGFFNTNGTFRSGNIVIANNGVGNTSSITFDKSTDGPSINVVEYANDSTMYEFALRDNPDGGSDFFHWVMPDWQNSSSGWKPLKFSNFVTQIVGQSSNFWSSFSLPSSTPYYTTNPESLSTAAIKWDPYTSTSYNLPKDNGTGTGVFNVDITGFTGTNNTIYWVIIQAGATTFNWGTGWSGNAPVGTGVAITGGWQTLGDGVQVRIIGSVAASDRWAFRAFPVPKMGIGTTTPLAPLQISSTVRPTSTLAQGVYANPTLVATANNDTLVGLDINPTFTNGSYTGVSNYAARIQGNTLIGTGAFTYGNTISTGGKLTIVNTSGYNGLVISHGVGSYQLTINTTFNDNIGVKFSWNDGISNPFLQHANNIGTILGTTNQTVTIKGNTTILGYSPSYGSYAEGMRVSATTGNVLINTTTDSGYRLDVNGTTRTSGLIFSTGYFSGILYATTNVSVQSAGEPNIHKYLGGLLSNAGATGDLYYYTGGLERLRITSAGNVGIGTSSPSEKLHIFGNLRVQTSAAANTASTATIELNPETTTPAYIQAVSNFGPTSPTVYSAGLKFIVSNRDASLPSPYYSIDALSILANGNIGIGTTTPSSLLHVKSTAAIADVAFFQSSTNGLCISFNGSRTGFHTTPAGVFFSPFFGFTGGSNVQIGLGNEDALARLHVRGSGTTSSTIALLVQNSTPNTLLQVEDGGTTRITGPTPYLMVGVPSNQSPTSRLTVGGTGLFTYDGYSNVGGFYIDQGGTSNASRTMWYDGAGTVKNLITGNGNSYITAGNLGIGTTTPTYNLEVSSTGYTGFGVMSGANNNAEIGFQNRGYGLPRWTIRATGTPDGSSGNLTFQRLGGNFLLTLTSGENVLIGTTTDSGYKLDVNGTGIFRDNLKLVTGVLSFDGVTSYWGNSIKYESSQIRIYQSGDLHAAFGGSANYLYKNTKISPNLLLTAGGYSNTDGITIWGTQNGTNGGDGFVGRNLYYNGTNYVYATTDSNSLWGTVAGVRVLGSSSNALEFVARPATNSGLNVVASDIASYTRMVISYSGNIGIGTTSPTGRLHVWNGGIKTTGFPSSGNPFNFLESNYNDTSVAVRFQNINPSNGLDADLGIQLMNTSGSFTDVLRIKGSTGRVGIGTTSPSTLLDVNGVITATGGNSTNWNTAYGWGNHSSAGYVPQARTLTINGTTYDLSANRSWTIATTTPGGSNTQFQYNSSGTLAGASALTYDSGTNRVGINQASPGYDLDVNGQVRVQDKLRVGNVNSGNGVVHMSSTATINPSATTIVWSQNVSVGMCAFIEYYILNNNTTTDQRAGTIMVTWNQSGTPTIAHTETTTPDIGSTIAVNFTSSLVGSDARINAVNSSAAPYTIVMSYKYF